MTRKLIHFCARATTFPELREKLIDYGSEVKDWNALLLEAEQQGLGPLLHWHLQHLGVSCPDQFRRSARLLFLRHHHVNTIYAKAQRDRLVEAANCLPKNPCRLAALTPPYPLAEVCAG
jgi:hypothetical protein